jgi:hypothetical protein
MSMPPAHDQNEVQGIALPAGYRPDLSVGDWQLQEGAQYTWKTQDFTLIWDEDSSGMLQIMIHGPLKHPNEGADTIEEKLSLGLLDDQNQPVEGIWPIQITDSIPWGLELYFETDSVQAGDSLAGVWQGDLGMDKEGAAFSLRVFAAERVDPFMTALFAPGELEVRDGETLYGTLTISADGYYTFAAAEGAKGDLRFSLGAADGDGDTVWSAKVPLAVTASPPPVEPVELPPLTFEENTLADGPEATAQTIVLYKGYSVDTTGWTATDDGALIKDHAPFRLLYKDGELRCELVEAVEHSSQYFTASIENLPLIDAEGQSVTATVPITVVDADGGGGWGLSATDVSWGGTIQGTWWKDVYVDGKSEAMGDAVCYFSVTYPGQSAPQIILAQPGVLHTLASDASGPDGAITYGTLVIDAKGEFIFTAAAVTADIEISLGSADNDDRDVCWVCSETLHIKAPVVPDFPLLEFYESGLPGGSAENTVPTSQAVILPDGYSLDPTGWTDLGSGEFELASGPFTLHYSADRKTIGITLDGPYPHADGAEGGLFSDFPLMLRDGSNATFAAPLSYALYDDQPSIVQFDLAGDIVAAGGSLEGAWQGAFGADAVGAAYSFRAFALGGEKPFMEASFKPGALEISDGTTTYGHLEIADNGTFRFTAAPGVAADLGFALGVTDADGDAVWSPPTPVSIVEIGPIIEMEPFVFAASESALPWGSDPGGGPLTHSVVIPPTAELLFDRGWNWETTATGYVAPYKSGILEYNSETRVFSYTLTGAWDNSALEPLIVVGMPVRYAGSDEVRQWDMFISIQDDVPVFANTGPGNLDIGADGANYGVSIALSLLFGADIDPGATSFSVAVSNSYEPAAGSAETGSREYKVPLDGKAVSVAGALGKGSLRYDAASGKLLFDYEATQGARGDTEYFNFSYMDDDGSSAQVDLSLRMATDRGPVNPTPLPDVDGELATGYAPDYNAVDLLGDFRSAEAAGGQGWLYSGVQWSSRLPSYMEDMPTVPELEAFDDGRSIRLHACLMTVKTAARHLEGNSITEILDDLGIETSNYYVKDEGLSRLSLASRSFRAEEGEIVFNWSFSGRAWAGESDAAFWVLLGEDGEVMDSGKIAHLTDPAQGPVLDSGVTHIALPQSVMPAEYKLVVGVVDGGFRNVAAARLNIDSMALFSDPCLMSGNAIEDSVASGGLDAAYADAVASAVVYGGVTYSFRGAALDIPTASGILTVGRDGSFVLRAMNSAGAPEPETLDWLLAGPDGAVVHLKQTLALQSAEAFDNLALENHGYDSQTRLGSFESPSTANALMGNDWYRSGNVYTGRNYLTSDGLPVPETDILAASSGEPYPWVRLRPTTNMDGKAREALFGTRDINEIEEILNDIGIEGNAFGYRASSTGLRAAVIQKDFSSDGGEISFGWSYRGAVGSKDAAYWLLKNSEGDIVQSGVLHQSGSLENGIASIIIAETSEMESYSLQIGAVNVGTTAGKSPTLYVGDVLLLQGEHHFSGNVVDDPSPKGEVDLVYADTRLESVSYGDETKTFDENHSSHVFKTDDGVLTINDAGEYQYKAHQGYDAPVDDQFSYSLRGAEPGDSATLTVQHGPVIFDPLPYRYTLQSQDAKDGTIRIDSFVQSKDKLAFEDLLGQGEKLNQYLEEHVSDLSLNINANTLRFTLDEGTSAVREVEVSLVEEKSYIQLEYEYRFADGNGEEQALLMQYLQTIAG